MLIVIIQITGTQLLTVNNIVTELLTATIRITVSEFLTASTAITFAELLISIITNIVTIAGVKILSY